MNALFVGLTTIDLQYIIEGHPAPNTKVKTNAPDLMVGGPAANAAVAFSHLGGTCNFITLFGDNPFHSFFQQDMSQYNVQAWDLASDKEKPAVLATVLTNEQNGDRTIVTNNPEDDFKSFHLLQKLLDGIDYDIILWDGFYPSVAETVFKHAKSKNVPVVFDGGSWKSWLEPLLKYIDIAICSEVFLPPGCGSKADVLEFLQCYSIPHCIVTRGEKSILIHKESQQIEELEIKRINSVVDTLGAGDIFHGAFVYHYLKTKEMKKALLCASEVAGKSIQYEGTRSWMKR